MMPEEKAKIVEMKPDEDCVCAGNGGKART
jgi:hypothetical protein